MTNQTLDTVYGTLEINFKSTNRYSPIFLQKQFELGQFCDAREYTAHSNAAPLLSRFVGR